MTTTSDASSEPAAPSMTTSAKSALPASTSTAPLKTDTPKITTTPGGVESSVKTSMRTEASTTSGGKQTRRETDPTTKTTSSSKTSVKPSSAVKSTTPKWDTTTGVRHLPIDWVYSTTDYVSHAASTTPSTSTTPARPKTTRPGSTAPPLTTSYCEQVCPDDYFEGQLGCIMLMTTNGSYMQAAGRCQLLPRGDLIGAMDIQPEFAAISALMKSNGMQANKFFINMYSNDLLRKEKKAQVVYIGASSVELTVNASIVPRGEQQPDVATICKIPKNCLAWTCPTSYALQDAPNVEFDDPQPPRVLNSEETLHYRCKNQAVNNRRFEAYCTERGSMGPMASIYDLACKPDENAKPVRDPNVIKEDPIPNMSCDMCVDMGTDHCQKGKDGVPDACICKEGWTGINCWRFPKFCPNMTCPEEATCEERVDHAVCVCQTELCVVLARQANRSFEMQFLDKAVMFGGPSFEFFMRLVLQVLFPERGDTIQDSLQYMRATFVSCAGVAYIFGGDPATLKIDIAERRIMSILFHFPQILVHLLFALECYHIDCVMRGTSDNKWQTCRKEKGKRWDYGWTYAPTITLAFFFSIGIWYLNWETHQRAFTSVGVMDSNFGMLGWASIAYGLCATYSFFHGMDVLLDPNRRYFEIIRRDNFYETSMDPTRQEEADMCWRNLLVVMVSAPVQCAYSISMIANLAWDLKEIKYINLALLAINTILGVVQTIQCDRKFLGWIESWLMMKKPLEERFNEFNYLTTSEAIAKKGRPAYEEMLQKREEAKQARKRQIAEKIEGYKTKFEKEKIPMMFLPHAPLDGPEPCMKYNYDPCHKNYLSEREREWKYIMWTNQYLGARVKLGITVVDACEFVQNALFDNGFLVGDDCPSKQAWVMFREWVDMMLYQDRMDYAKLTPTEKAWHKALPKELTDELKGLSLGNRLREAPIDPKKRRLVEPLIDMFSYSCPPQLETGPGLRMDQFGMMWDCEIYKALPVITRAQEAKIWQAYKDDDKTDHARWDRIYTDDERYKEAKDQPWEAALKETHLYHDAFPEGENVRSLNPRMGPIDYAHLDQTRPDFIGPKEPHFHIPCGLLLRRHWLDVTFAVTRNRMFDMIVEQAGMRRNNAIIRDYIANNPR